MRRLLILITFGLFLAVAYHDVSADDGQGKPTPGGTLKKSDNPLVAMNYGPAPELTNEIWINSDKPLRLKDLRGKVVLLEFWTFGCYNCQNTLPAMREFQEKYADKDLVIIGDHYPEFSYERDVENVKVAVKKAGIEYAVAIDNDGKVWAAYQQRYWPVMYLIDKQGDIRYKAIGEHDYTITEQAIQALLSEELVLERQR